jgi:WXG100 family type VII secretion target
MENTGMSNQIVQAQYETLDRVAQRFAEQAEVQKQLQRAVERAANPLQNGAWIGRGSDAFLAEMQGEVTPALQRLISALQEAQSVTTQMRQVMQEAEAEAARLFQVAAGVLASAAGDSSGPPGVELGDTGGEAPNRSFSEPPKPRVRIYTLGGIDSDGNMVALDTGGNFTRGDDQALGLEQILEKSGFDPKQVTAMDATYLAPRGTQFIGTNVTGTQLGGWLSPIDWVTEQGVAGLNAVTRSAAGAVNTVTGFVAGIPGVSQVVGGGQVLVEYYAGRFGPETNSSFDFIQRDLKNNPLLPGETIILVGHSGGGAINANLAGKLERELGVDVKGVVNVNSPLANLREASRYAEYVVDFHHKNDIVYEAGKLVYGLEMTQFRNSQLVYSRATDIDFPINTPYSGTLGAHMEGTEPGPAGVLLGDVVQRVARDDPSLQQR